MKALIDQPQGRPHPTVIFLELNEVNFDFLQRYVERGHLPNFKAFLSSHGYSETSSEDRYEILEPWIQWVTAHTGLTFSEHQIFRLGDIIDKDLVQIWERLAEHGISVGATSPMNAKCRGERWDFFLPDPWTDTDVVAPYTARLLHDAVRQAVSDNAQSKLTLRSVLGLCLGLAKYALPSSYPRYLSCLMKAPFKPWAKALFLDRLLADLHIKLTRKNSTQFSTLFLNAAAHIQHHYLFASEAYQGDQSNPSWYIKPGDDPVLEAYSLYDEILGDVVSRFPNARIMLGTGLHQEPHANTTFYWRLKDHAQFLSLIDVPFESVEPRMSRDFLVCCSDSEQAKKAEQVLNGCQTNDGEPMFEVDKRDKDLFVTLSLSRDASSVETFFVGNKAYPAFGQHVAFVAIKNGQHNGVGYFADSGRSNRHGREAQRLEKIPEFILDAFSLDGERLAD